MADGHDRRCACRRGPAGGCPGDHRRRGRARELPGRPAPSRGCAPARGHRAGIELQRDCGQRRPRQLRGPAGGRLPAERQHARLLDRRNVSSGRARPDRGRPARPPPRPGQRDHRGHCGPGPDRHRHHRHRHHRGCRRARAPAAAVARRHPGGPAGASHGARRRPLRERRGLGVRHHGNPLLHPGPEPDRDRRRLPGGEPLPGQRPQHHQRHPGAGLDLRADGLCGGGAGQDRRLRGRVRPLDRRRHQPGHQVRHQHAARRREPVLGAGRAAGTAARHLHHRQPGAGADCQPQPGRGAGVSRSQPVARRADRPRPSVRLRFRALG